MRPNLSPAIIVKKILVIQHKLEASNQAWRGSMAIGEATLVHQTNKRQSNYKLWQESYSSTAAIQWEYPNEKIAILLLHS